MSELLLTKALFGAARLRDAGFPLAVAMGVSPAWLTQPRLPDFLRANFRATGIPADQVILKIAGTTAPPALAELRVAVDDFDPKGPPAEVLQLTGLNGPKLKRPAQRGDPRGNPASPNRLTRAKALGFILMAVGIQTTQDLELTRALGCDWVQGDLLAEAMPVGTLIDSLRSVPSS